MCEYLGVKPWCVLKEKALNWAEVGNRLVALSADLFRQV